MYPYGPRRGARPSARTIAEANANMLRRQRALRTAAEYVARAFAQSPEVEKVVLIGSVASPLKEEVPRFREFRRASVEILHECKDVDVAVWLSDLACLRTLQQSRSRALNALFRERGIGVAHHQVDVFVMEPATNRYLGRLCCFNACPKGKPECRVPGCGATAFLRQHEGFVLESATLRESAVFVLYERGAPA